MSTQQKPMVVGMIGVGGFGGYRRARMRESGLFRLAACYDRNPENLKLACQQDSAKPCASIDELLATPGLEGMVISTGVDSHADLAIRAMRANLHVFVEKPLCGRPEEIPQMIAVRNQTKRIFASGHSHHGTDAVYRLARQYIDEGKLGTLACYEENTSHSGGLEIHPGDWRGLRERNPGGMLLQCGVHSLHRLVHLFGPVEQVMCMMRYDANPNTQTADVANVLLRHPGGLLGTLNAYHVTAYIHEFRLFGTKGTLYFDTHHCRVWFQERRRNETEERVEVPLPKPDPEHAFSNLANWYRAVRQGTAPAPSLEDGIEAVLPVFAAEVSSEQGRIVALSELRETIRA